MTTNNIAFYLDNLFGKESTEKVGEFYEHTFAYPASKRERHKMKLSKARIKRASVRGKILMLRIWSKEYGKVVRFKRCLYLEDTEDGHTFRIPNPHPRRALIVIEGIKTPVRIKGKK